MNDSEKEIVVATIANQMFNQLTLQQALEIVQGATIQAGQAEYDKMPDDKKKEILDQGAQWRQQIQEQFEQQRENSEKIVDK
jgi:hypothetical protein